jgi:Sulfotransferase family
VTGITYGDDFPQPIFVLAPPRSFTTLISGILGQHPALLDSPELNLFRTRTMRRFMTLHRLHMGLHRFVAQLYAGEQSIEAVEMAQNWVRARESRTTAEVHRELCAKIAPRALVQKSPRYMRRLSHMRTMLDAFPRARFIHLVRHPRAVSESFLNMHDVSLRLLACAACGAIDASGSGIVADPQILWHDYHLRILRFQEMVSPEQWLRVKGEAFLADLDNQLLRVCKWLGISTAPEAIAAMKRPEDSPFACFGPPNALFGNDPNFLRSPQLRPFKDRQESLEGPLPWRQDGAPFHPRVVELAHEFGYA